MAHPQATSRQLLPRVILSAGILLGASCLPSPADLVAHYALDEAPTDDAILTDSLGANNGVFINPPGITRGVPSPGPSLGTACDFSLRSGANLGTGPEVRPIDQFTLTWWMRPTTLNAFDRIYETMSGTSNGANGIRIDLRARAPSKIPSSASRFASACPSCQTPRCAPTMRHSSSTPQVPCWPP